MRRFKFLAFALCSIWMAACTEIFEKDIEDQKITIYTPSGKDSLNYIQTFWWSQIDFATSYQLQVVSPSFDAPEKMILDTIVTTNRFPYYVGPGSFEWKVRAMNGAYKTNYFGNTFKIVVTSLSEQNVFLRYPENNAQVNGTSITFRWDKLLGATSYKIQIATDRNFTSPIEEETQNLSFPFSINEDQTYFWRVMALNDSEYTNWSNYFIVNVKNSPAKVLLDAPANNSSVDQTVNGVTLKWNSLGVGYKYDVYIREGEAGSFEVFARDVTTTNVVYKGTSGETVSWKVVGKNANGVEGDASNVWKFTIN
jgi:hypothetical protein